MRLELSSGLGTVRPRERGDGYRIDLRPYGMLYTVSGERFETKEDAGFILRAIRREVKHGRTVDEAMSRYVAPEARPNQLARRYQSWLDFKAKQAANGDLSQRTLREYARYARQDGELSFWGDSSVHDISTASLEEWSLWLADQGLSPKSRCNVMRALRSCLGWLKERGLFTGEIPRFPTPRVPEHRPNILAPQAQARVLAAIPEDARGIFLTMGLLALRPGEARALDRRHILEEGLLVVDCAMQGMAADAPIGPTKSGKFRHLFILEELQDWLERHLLPAEPDAPLFTNPKTGRRWGYYPLRDVWNRACAEVGVEVKMYEGTRHSAATAAAARGASDLAVQTLLGHSRNSRATALYAKLSGRNLKGALK